MNAPQVSIVMSVYNAAPSLAATLASVLGQHGCELELIAIDDGSTDGTAAVLDAAAAADPRLRVVHQDNAGLTRSLATGCALARGEFIARQDADDISLPGRFAAQVAALRAQPAAVAVVGALRVVAPGGEWVQDLTPPPRLVADVSGKTIALPPLVAACFRRSAYEAAGGFRAPFVVAQDIDMWLRLMEQGPCIGIAGSVYQATLTAGGISSRRRPEQLRMAALALACARERRAGRDDAALMAAAGAAPRRARSAPSRARERADFHYFVASCLRERDPQAARRYFDLALSDNPFHLKALVRRWISTLA